MQTLNDSDHLTMLQQSEAYLTALLNAMGITSRERSTKIFGKSESHVDYVFYLWMVFERMTSQMPCTQVDLVRATLELKLPEEVCVNFKKLFFVDLSPNNANSTYFTLQPEYTFSPQQMAALEALEGTESEDDQDPDSSTEAAIEYLPVVPNKKSNKPEEEKRISGRVQVTHIVMPPKQSTEAQIVAERLAQEKAEAERQAQVLAEAEAKRAQEEEERQIRAEAEKLEAEQRAREAEKRAREAQAEEKLIREEAEAHEQELETVAARKNLELREAKQRLEVGDQATRTSPFPLPAIRQPRLSKNILKQHLNEAVNRLGLRVENVEDHESKDTLAGLAKAWFKIWCLKEKIEGLRSRDMLQLGLDLIGHMLACIDGGMSEFLGYQKFHDANKENLDTPSWRDAAFFEAVQKKIAENQAKLSDRSGEEKEIAIELPDPREDLTQALVALKAEADLDVSICSNQYIIKRFFLRPKTKSLYEEYLELSKKTDQAGSPFLKDDEIPAFTRLVKATTLLKHTSFAYMDSPQDEVKREAYSGALSEYNQSLRNFEQSPAGDKQLREREATYNSCKYFALAIMGGVLAAVSMALIIAAPYSAPIGIFGLKISMDMMLGGFVAGVLIFEFGTYKEEQRLLNKNRLFSNNLELNEPAKKAPPARSPARM